ncbi:hypothetical protein FLJC2902T_32190 [Flavobacterium limnosediminis JC2902]|uniref:Lipocalin-like domain-containing protein n=1 Tax=Flavobacterium limnosediminis JC2902 TaxID=1341181 RepID=V6SB09_9FLAO|nr:hypothetical protein [Flavobacterium limnosediminis]ESU23806.1 hypothetical protein FLJC2902T_32190 [Flavobacterium limnosediminis JC2902]
MSKKNYIWIIVMGFISFSFINIKGNDKISLEKSWVLESRINDISTYKSNKTLPKNCEGFEFSKNGTYLEISDYATRAKEHNYEISNGTWERKSDSILILRTEYFLQRYQIIKLTKNQLILKRSNFKPKKTVL